MRRASWGRRVGSAMALLFALGVASAARADVPPLDPPKTAAPAASAAPKNAAPAQKPLFRGHARRPIFLGLLAAMFLIIGALAGANDRPGGKAPPPRA